MSIELLIVFLVIAGAGSLFGWSRWNTPKRKWERDMRQSERDRKRMVKL